jgi:uncharacterized membrane protein YeaQ/YmgE (transglycosylase-associated protein family)
MNLLADYGFFAWIIIGAVAGGLAKFIMPGRDPGGCIVTILLGVAGAAVAGFVGTQLDIYKDNQGAGLIGAVIGALLILLVYRLLRGRRR